MAGFRVLLATVFATIVVYTLIVVANHGFGLFAVLFGDIARFGWPGQFNLDFMSLLALAALWLAWRHHFSPLGIGLGVLGFFGGAPVLTPYLFVASFAVKGNVEKLVLGEVRATS